MNTIHRYCLRASSGGWIHQIEFAIGTRGKASEAPLTVLLIVKKQPVHRRDLPLGSSPTLTVNFKADINRKDVLRLTYHMTKNLSIKYGSTLD